MANAIYPLIEEVEPLQECLEGYSNQYLSNFNNMMANKLGFATFDSKTDQELIDEIPALLQLAEIDMTIFYRNLNKINLGADIISSETVHQILSPAFYQLEEFNDAVTNQIYQWVLSYQKLFKEKNITNDNRVKNMNSTNPLYVLRNYLAQEAIELSENGDDSRVNELLEVLRNPYTEQKGKEAFAEKRPEWARTKPGCSTLSCSS